MKKRPERTLETDLTALASHLAKELLEILMHYGEDKRAANNQELQEILLRRLDFMTPKLTEACILAVPTTMKG